MTASGSEPSLPPSRRFLAVGAAAGWLLVAAFTAFAATDNSFQAVTVKPGDTLWSIAQKYLRDPSRWDEILKHNKLPSSDPTVALPGMTLRVPIQLIKEDLRAAHLIYRLNKVNFRRQETADWKNASDNMELFRGDSLRTLDASQAKVKFLNADLLSLDPNSMAILKPPNKDFDVELKKGGLFAGRSRVVTASARITPQTQDTKYSAKVRQDLSTLVEVLSGRAEVDAEGQRVQVTAGMATEVRLGQAPGTPIKIADLPDFEARAAEFSGTQVSGQARIKIAAPKTPEPVIDGASAPQNIEGMRGDIESLSVGMPVSGYRVQGSPTREFAKIVFDRVYEADERINLKSVKLPAGTYWWRIAMIDLLGSEGSFAPPKAYSISDSSRD